MNNKPEPQQIVIEPSPVHAVDTPPPVLTIAGSDSGGGAGVQADLKTFAAFDTIGSSVITAVTAQNTVGVTAVHVVPVEVIEAQMCAVLDDLQPRAVKTGMLATPEVIDLVVGFAQDGSLPNLVVDPVMVATSGDRLLAETAERQYVEQLFQHARVVTPNAVEAGILCGREIHTIEDLHLAAQQLTETTGGSVVVKGGHIAGERSVDVVCDGEQCIELVSPRLDTRNTHGTGCTFAAAVAAELALGSSTADAIVSAKTYICDAIAGAANWSVGNGHGPVDHTIRR